MRRLLLLVLAVIAAGSLPASIALARAAGPSRAAAAEARRALAAVDVADPRAAHQHFLAAEELFSTANERVSGAVVSAGLAVPILRQNLQATRLLTAAGARLASIGAQLAADVDPGRLRVVGGVVPVAQLAAMHPELDRSARELERVLDQLRGQSDAVLIPPLRRAIDDGRDHLRRADRRVDLVRRVAELAPAIFGDGRPRRYFLAVQNNDESRPTGGFIGNFGELVAEGGRVRLERFGRVAELNDGGTATRDLRAPASYLARYDRFEPERTWQNVNLSPDFPTVGSVIADLYPQSGGASIDGVIAVDPPGLAALLELTGPVPVPGWPEPLTADNAVQVLLHDAYVAFPGGERADFLGDAAEAVWERLLDAPLGTSRRVLDALAPAVERGHVQVWLTSPAEQRLVRRAGLDGAVPDATNDSLLVTTSNAGANKIDWFLTRTLRYQVSLRPTDERALVSGKVQVTLRNDAPSGGLPPYLIGPAAAVPGARGGDNVTFLSLYTPLRFDGARLDGRPQGLESQEELGRFVYSTFLTVPARSSRMLEVALRGEVDLAPDGSYELDLGRQPLLRPEEVAVEVEVPSGFRITEAEGGSIGEGGRSLSFRASSGGRLRTRVRVVPE